MSTNQQQNSYERPSFDLTSGFAGCLVETPIGAVALQAALSSGSFGSVYQAEMTNGEEAFRCYAVKIVSRCSEHGANAFAYEAETLEWLRHAQHRRIVGYHGNYVPQENPDFGLLFFDLATFGSLEDLQAEFGIGIPVHRAWDYFQQILDGLAFIHSEGIFHNDIKPANILCNRPGSVQIADFGLASHNHQDRSQIPMNFGEGTVSFQPPEIFTDGQFAADCGDLWAATITFVTVVTNEVPWEAASDEEELFAEFKSGEFPEDYWDKLEEFKEEVLGFLECDPDNRAIPRLYSDHLEIYLR
ncbi:hypothetical protein L596_018339 [Steinernema carpocapsae]|uniref:Protein kinase domain-containing protein n=1 Tax=Steinernema carpocapsae TaxID=34508 RepID=A0A4U5N4T3_STECR|nr:hypothetical protein L596_018339 [Steinernema carpocapsae]